MWFNLKLLISDNYGKRKLIEAQALPHKGDKVCWENRFPRPEVNNVIMWPDQQTLNDYECSDILDIEAIILISY